MAVVLDSYRDDPVGFVEEVLGDAPYAKQREMLEAVVHNRRVSVVGANGSGKDWAAARAVLWWIATRPRATVVVTGPTQRQVEEIVWRELRGAYKASRVPLGGRVSGSHWNIDDDRFAIGFSTNRPENLQGFHSPELLVVVTEAHAVPQGHMEALKRLIPARMLLTGNAFSRDGEFFDSHHTKRHLYTRIAISAFDTPNFTGENGGIPGTPTEEDVEERKLDWGEDHPLYQGSVLARFPDMLDDSLIGRTVIEQAVERWEQYYKAGSATCHSERSAAEPRNLSGDVPLCTDASPERCFGLAFNMTKQGIRVIPNRAQLPYLVIPSGAQRSRGISQVTFRCAPTHPPRDVSAALNMTKQGIRVIPNRAQLPYLVIPSGAQRSRGISQVTFRCAPTHPPRDVSAALNMTKQGIRVIPNRAQLPYLVIPSGAQRSRGISQVTFRCAPTHPPRDVSAALNMTKQGIRVIPNRAQLPYLVIPSGAQRSRGISQVTFRCAPTHPPRDVSAALNMTMPSPPPPPAGWAWTLRASAPTRRRSACGRAGSSSPCAPSSVSTRCAPRARR